MITFTLCLLALIAGYFIYGRFIERVFGPDDRKTPALTHADGVDYIPLPTWKIFMIQFLNIAGLGPIFGAIMGAKFGVASYLWIVLGSIFAGAVLAILGVIAAPITSGDTAFRSARLIVADFMGMEQKSMRRRLFICVPMFLVAIGLLLYSLRDKNGFDMIWRYFAWANQTLSVFTLWAVTVYLVRAKKLYWLTLIPALFMTVVCSTYMCIAPEGLGLSHMVSYSVGMGTALVAIIWFAAWKRRADRIIYNLI